LASDYPIGIFKLLTIVLSVLWFMPWLLITPLVSSNFWPLCCLSYDLCLGFWLPHWYLQTFDHCVVCPMIYALASDYPFWNLQTFLIQDSILLIVQFIQISLYSQTCIKRSQMGSRKSDLI